MSSRKGARARWLAVLLVLALTAGGGFAYYRLHQTETIADLPVATARQGEFRVLVRCRGELVARRSSTILAPRNVPDMRIIWMAPANSPVAEGDPLIRFDPSAARNLLIEKQAALQQAEASLDQAGAQARLTAEQDIRDLANARYTVERAKLEVKKKSLQGAMQGEASQIDLDVAEKKLRVQEATNALHESSTKTKLASLGRMRDQAKADIELNQLRLTQMEVKAPNAGIMVYNTNYNANPARPFAVGDQVWAGASIAELPDLDSLVMNAKIEEVDRSRVQKGAEARVRIDSLPELSLSAKLIGISPLTLISISDYPMTASFRGLAELLQKDDRLRPGMLGTLDAVSQRLPDAVSIPAKALFDRHGRPIVYRARKGGYDIVEVKVLARNPDEVAVDGIHGGDKVALVEPGTLVPGESTGAEKKP